MKEARKARSSGNLGIPRDELVSPTSSHETSARIFDAAPASDRSGTSSSWIPGTGQRWGYSNRVASSWFQKAQVPLIGFRVVSRVFGRPRQVPRISCSRRLFSRPPDLALRAETGTDRRTKALTLNARPSTPKPKPFHHGPRNPSRLHSPANACSFAAIFQCSARTVRFRRHRIRAPAHHPPPLRTRGG